MRNYPYVVVISVIPPYSAFLMEVLDVLKIPSFFPDLYLQSDEDRYQRLRTELDKADAVLVGVNAQGVSSEFKESEIIKSRKSRDPAFKIIPVVAGWDPVTLPDWLRGVEPLHLDLNDPARTISSVVKSLIPDIETEAEETEPEASLDALAAEAERLVLRLESTFDQYRHSRILLGISFLVFASGVSLVTIGIWIGAGNAFSGILQFLGLVVLPLSGIFLLYSIVNWSSNLQRNLRSRRLIEEGHSIILEYKSFREANPRQAAHETGPFGELVKRFSEFLGTYRPKAATTAKERNETVKAESSSQQSEKEEKEE